MLADCVTGWVADLVVDWLVSWKPVKYDLHWEHVVANPSPRYAYSPIVCDSWLYLRRGEERQVGIRLCISVAELRVRSTSGWLGGLCVVCHFCDSDSITWRAHTDTHNSPAHLLLCSRSVCAQSSISGTQTANPAHRCTPTQTNKHTCCSWQVALTISRRREGKQNKQFNLHDSSLLYISMPWQW